MSDEWFKENKDLKAAIFTFSGFYTNLDTRDKNKYTKIFAEEFQRAYERISQRLISLNKESDLFNFFLYYNGILDNLISILEGLKTNTTISEQASDSGMVLGMLMAIIDNGIVSSSFSRIIHRASSKLHEVGSNHDLNFNATELVSKIEIIIKLMTTKFRDMNTNANYYFIGKRIEKIGTIHFDSLNAEQRNLLLSIRKILE